MSDSGIKSYLLFATVLIAGFGSSAYLSASLERSRPSLPVTFVDADLTFPGSRMRGFSLGAEGLIADWYYMRSLQYIGDKILATRAENINLDDLRSLNPRLLYPLLDNATDLDPHFLGAYFYGAVVLPAIDGDQAIKLTEKGIENNPDSWRLYQHLGYIYWKLGQYDKAAEAYESGSKIEGAAPFMKLMVGSMRSEGGSRDTARQIFEQMLAGTEDPAVRVTAERRLAQIKSLDERDAINEVLTEYKARSGRCPATLNEIMPSLTKVKLPGNNQFRLDNNDRLADPNGVPYSLDPVACQVKPDVAQAGGMK